MRADIFCRVVDNYGDIGVCWRLARRLAHGHGWQVRLWVDELRAFARIQPGVSSDQTRQTVEGVDILHWTQDDDLAGVIPGDVVIEAFACDPPAAFVQAMRAQVQSGDRQPVWLNLEYLSAESWVESCHGLPSMQADGLVKHFFFPGFTKGTGGLLREPGLSAQRDEMQASREAQARFLSETLAVKADALGHWHGGARLVSLFCYPYAPVNALVRGLLDDERPSLLLVPEGVAPGLEETLWAARTAGRAHAGAHLRIARVPFVAQPDFDRLLWCADLNFVRGEDSFVRAAWAARPLVWQIYAQDEDAHLDKLQAWLARYPGPPAAQALIRAWNRAPGAFAGDDGVATAWDTAPDRADACTAADSAFSATLRAALREPAWSAWQAAALRWDAEQASRADLADSLAFFCAEKLKKR
ncbi:elongation factor P maturation arginine rhamnosyltransferase EarP [Bordetella sp. 15P40C-2]|uniref:elongation factor P maturation arginine rhamnosyltransferase EarP n=1 Tax=Bordetella sp. 15P40C-2 TaxID=2572246 RepID=UPI00132A63B9|nr:elongation factor P maturation arginine rhamnosyltransferase EarP [Bordetella sp. 15P40C-2]